MIIKVHAPISSRVLWERSLDLAPWTIPTPVIKAAPNRDISCGTVHAKVAALLPVTHPSLCLKCGTSQPGHDL